MKGITSFFNEVLTELKKVNWPTRVETVKMTIIVISVTFVIGVYVGSIDFGLTKFIETFVR